MFKLMWDERKRDIGHWAMEFVVVVLGVLIALLAQQWANNRASRRQAIDAEVRIRQEIYSNAVVLIERVVLHRCVKERLAGLAAALTAGTHDWTSKFSTFPDKGEFALGRMYRVPSRSINTDAYSSALASGALASVDPDRLALWSMIYRQSEKAYQLNMLENDRGQELSGLAFNPVLTVSERNDLFKTVAKLDRYNGLMMIMARQNIKSIKQLGYQMTPDEVEEASEYMVGVGGNGDIQNWNRIYGNCADPAAVKLVDPRIRVTVPANSTG